MQGNRLVAAAVGVALSIGGMLATAGPAVASSGPSVTASASSSCTDRNRVLISVAVQNKERRAVVVWINTPFGRESAVVGGGDKRTLTIRTDRRNVDRGSVTVTARKVNGGDRSSITRSYSAKRCGGGEPRIEVTAQDTDDDGRLDGVRVRNTGSSRVQVRVIIGRERKSESLDPGETLRMRANDSQRSGVAIATRRDDGKLLSTVRVFRA